METCRVALTIQVSALLGFVPAMTEQKGSFYTDSKKFTLCSVWGECMSVCATGMSLMRDSIL